MPKAAEAEALVLIEQESSADVELMVRSVGEESLDRSVVNCIC